METVDGYTIERDGDVVSITFSDRYGSGHVYRLPVNDAMKVAMAMMKAVML